MSKKFIGLSLVVILILFISTIIATSLQAQETVPVISLGTAPSGDIQEIGDLQIGQVRSITVKGLKSGVKYHWRESKLTSAITLPGSSPEYARLLTECHIANSNGEILKNIGPYSLPGLYKIEVSYASTSSSQCEAGSDSISKEFSVGGATRQSCCTPLFPVYDSGQDKCKKGPLPLEETIETECSNTNPKSYCEPESLQCFTTKTLVKSSKICATPEDVARDPNRYTICAEAGGQKIPGCTDVKDNPGIATAIGCIRTSPVGFIQDLLKFVIAISGGLAFLMMLLGAFQMLTSAGNPETLQAGRERLTSAVIGLLFVIFAVLLLQIIGVDILRLPGFFEKL